MFRRQNNVILKIITPDAVLLHLFQSYPETSKPLIEYHQAIAVRFGVAEAVLAELMDDVETAQVEEGLKPILHYVRKLTLSPAKMTPADAEAVYTAGWDERALHDVVSVCALFNFMNRLIEGLGIDTGMDYFQIASERLAAGGYAGLITLLNKEE